MNNPIGEAENQCIRGGAAMTYSKCKFDGAVVPPADPSHPFTPSTSDTDSTPALGTYPKVDMDSFTYSLAIDPDHANLLVHWAEEMTPQITTWQTSRVEPYDFRIPNDYRRLHHDVNNILDWGIGDRLKRIKRQLKQIGERLETENNRKRKIVPS